jgi:E3 ubiquitin-protein ligase RNF11
MGNCLRGQESDDESLLGTESDGEHEGGHQRRHRRRRRNRARVANYIPQNAVNIPDPTQYFNFGRNRTVNQLTEGEQIAVAQRLGMIQYLPTATWSKDEEQKVNECAICFEDFDEGDSIRYLPCVHFYHQKCVDDWLIRSFTCPSCMAPVELGLQLSMQTTSANSN